MDCNVAQCLSHIQLIREERLVVPKREFLTEDDLERMGIRKKRTLQKDRLLSRGFPYYKILGAIRYRRNDIENHLAACARGHRQNRGVDT